MKQIIILNCYYCAQKANKTRQKKQAEQVLKTEKEQENSLSDSLVTLKISQGHQIWHEHVIEKPRVGLSESPKSGKSTQF